MSVGVFFALLVVLALVIAPMGLVWGWIRWAKRPKMWTVAPISSLLGFALATASALLAVLTVACAQVHHFAFFDPLLGRIVLWGFLLSTAGLVFAIGGGWRRSELRWFALAGALGVLAFWMLATMGE